MPDNPAWADVEAALRKAEGAAFSADARKVYRDALAALYRLRQPPAVEVEYRLTEQDHNRLQSALRKSVKILPPAQSDEIAEHKFDTSKYVTLPETRPAVLRLQAEIAELRAALEIAELWLINCMPIGDVPGPKPLPVIRAALAKSQKAATKGNEQVDNTLNGGSIPLIGEDKHGR